MGGDSHALFGTLGQQVVMDTASDTLVLPLGLYDDFEHGECAASVLVCKFRIDQWWLDRCPPVCCGWECDSVGVPYRLVAMIGDNDVKSWNGAVTIDSLSKFFYRPERVIYFMREHLNIQVNKICRILSNSLSA